MAVKTFAAGDVLTASDTNTYLNNGGLVYITSATLTGVANSGTTFDGVFTSTYDNYRIVTAGLFGSTTVQNMIFQFRSAGPATMASNYYHGGYYCTFTGGTGTQTGNATASWPFSNIDNAGGKCGGVMDLQFPNSATAGIHTAQWQIFNNNAWVSYAGQHGTATAATGFILTVPAGTFTGTISVYGYRKP